MKLRAASDTNSAVPVPRMLAAFFVGALLAAVAIPAIGELLSGATGSPSPAVMFATWLAVTIISGAYLFPMSVVLGFRRDWYRFGLGCLALLELILFVLIPLSLAGQDDLGTAGHAGVGVASLLLALVVFGQIAKAARKYVAGNGWPVRAKAAMAGVAAVAGLLAQVVTAILLGNDPAGSALSIEGVAILVASALSGLSLAEGLDRATRPPLVAVEGRSLVAKTIRVGVGLLLALHVVWFVYLWRLF
ncbi:MAG TPA: hypothetical protein VHI31_01635 [Actinomycetota bacterium]|nr:hypothetical protein [Actinomycetota bacterium]